tara:strand:- start:2150 stop:2833 length:684 start_codon:yes stop_codon:yes gene_type:complete
VEAHHSIISFIVAAGPVVKCVVALLLAASVLSWTLIIQRGSFLKRTRKSARAFEDRFCGDVSLNNLYAGLNQHEANLAGLEKIFYQGYREYMRLQQQTHLPPDGIMERVQRVMSIASARESEKLEQHLQMLATIGSTSPYVGLFGTVWGIMTSFQALGQVQQATIAMVAPGISEALIATAMGLFAAIPAVIAYNRYANHADRLIHRYETFQAELYDVLARQCQQETA